ncbi:MAG: hypothetical protein ACI3VN_03760 [Candidatus Onthomonas sp.]
MHKLRIWKEQASRKKLITSLVLFLVISIPMQLVYQPLQATCDTKMMDFLIGYNAGTVYYVLNTIGASGRSQYLLLIELDLCYGLIYAAVFFLAISLLLKKGGAAGKWDKLLLLPLLAMIFDYTENICTIINILRFPTVSSAVTLIECTGTCLKYLFLVSCLVAIIALAISSHKKKTAA